MVIGVDPSHHGQGVGSGLIRPVLARADAGNVPCYLETAQPTNVAYYRRLGFRVVDDLVEPRSGLRLWTFLRDPHPA
jgi:predicted N-acetyltransferase YhbS